MAQAEKWDAGQIPDQQGRVIIITGANSGLGFESALALARKRARLLLACRSLERGQAARAAILAQAPEADLQVLALDLGSLESLRSFARAFLARYDRLDVLVNNAGVMGTPRRQTADGFELQFGVNHLGHFALTGLLLERLLATPGSRVVTVSSRMASIGRLNFDDLMHTRRYERWQAYGDSKLANLLFAEELQRRLQARQADVLSLAAHPGFAATNLQKSGPGLDGGKLALFSMRLAMPFAQSAQAGALPQLYAATAAPVAGGACYGPDGLGQLYGHPKEVQPSINQAWRDPRLAQRLWQISEELTGVRWLDG
jgi:NAD(P)-dependent dehydrogenase (short-subunit alcohol dehydrogenase family)